MFDIAGRVQVDEKVIGNLNRKNAIKSTEHIAAVLRRNMMQRIRKTKRKVSRPGDSPYTHTGALKRAIIFVRESDTCVVVGVSKRMFSGSRDGVPLAKVHEWGGVEIRQNYIRDYTNLEFTIGKPGIIAIRDGKPVFVKLTNDRMLSRANLLKKQVPIQVMARRRMSRYPARPFALPALNRARQFILTYKHKR